MVTFIKLLIDIGHPAHVHFFKNTIKTMEKDGHEVLVTARVKDVAVDLLMEYNIKHVVISKQGTSTGGLLKEWIIRDYDVFRIARKFKPDILTGMLNPCVAHASRLLGKKAIIFNDSEVVNSTAKITYPFCDAILTPSNFSKDLGYKQVRFNGYKELAYLHPNRFTPNPAVLDELNLTKDDKFVIVRFVAWKAGHDLGQKGLNLENKIQLVNELSNYTKVFITSESKLPDQLDQYRVKVSPSKMHDLLYYANFIVGDSQTMTTEAAVLGTPAIRSNTFVGANDMNNFIELEQKYGLIFNLSNPQEAIDKAVELAQTSNIKQQWNSKRYSLLKDKMDVTSFMVWFFENYPSSQIEMNKIGHQFK
ncbi:DUF354 domain-containing protein [Methanooceanicella nereidis]|uniref:DUF354 domain-containing protein n=1 Tax=Methanooceanicella nereidis TaxID=2052831 RepID=UPI001E6234BB